MFVGQLASGLPEDRIVNVFHFQAAEAYSSASFAARDQVRDFYTGANTTFSVGAYLSCYLSRAAKIVTYDLAEPPPRVPTELAFTLPDATSLNGLPEEVAVCLSMRGAIPPAAGPRRRGRVYIGPLNQSAYDTAATIRPARPIASFITDLTVAATRLQAAGIGGVLWCIRSERPVENFVPVSGGWVDNAFDTQRRRGPDATERTEWGIPPL